ncbi:hypothetical protein Hanom_Chr06g00531841 [Helianthus anomalus]
MITNYVSCFEQPKSTNIDARQNICCILDKSLQRMNPFKDIIIFINRSRIKKALTDKHKCYRSHIEWFWNNARYDEDSKTIVSALKIKDENQKDINNEYKFKVEDVRRVLDFQDNDKDPIQVPKRLVKGLWMRMGYTGYVNETSYNKSKLSQPYKFLVHSTIHALNHRKGRFDVSSDFVICILTCVILNRPFNISQALFNHMVNNIHGEKFLQYPRFFQMLLDDQIKNLSKVDADELKLDHMATETLKRMNVYQDVKKDKEPPSRKQFASILKPDYAAPAHDKRRHDDNNSDSEDKKMEPFSNKRGKFWLKVEDKKKKSDTTPKASKPTTPKATPKRSSKKKSPPLLVDEPDVPPENVNETGDDIFNMTFDEYEKISVAQVAREAEKQNKLVDEEDAPYVPTTAEAEKLKRGRGIKRSAKPTSATPRKQKIRNIVVKVVKDKTGESSKVLEKVSIEEPIVEAQVHVHTPPRSPI